MDSRVQIWCLFGDALQQIRHIVGTVEFRSQCDDITALADAEIVPLVQLGVHLERGFGLLSQRRFVPKAVTLLFYGCVAQTLQIVCYSDSFCILCSHIITVLMLMKIR